MPSENFKGERSQADELTRLCEEYSADMLAYARYKLGELHSGMAEDIVQESFLALWKNMRILEKVPLENRKRFLLSIVKCRVMDFFRNRPSADKVSIDDDESFFQLPDFSPAIETQIEGKELFDEICAAIQELSDTYRSVMEMKYIFHLKESEIARLLNLPKKTINVQVFRGKQKLRELLKDRMQEILYGYAGKE